MSAVEPYAILVEALARLGVLVLDEPGADAQGFPLHVPLGNGQVLSLDIVEPWLLSHFDQEHVGLALVDPSGFVRRSWGLATKVGLFKNSGSLTETPLAGLLQDAWRGVTGTLHLDGMRFHAAPFKQSELMSALLLVTDAREESSFRRSAGVNERRADLLKRIGKALTMNQTLQPMAVAAVHAVNSAAELAAVLLWVRSQDEGAMELIASVGANRAGASALAKLDTERGMSCAAELVAARQQPLTVRNIEENPITAELEGKFCYLRPGGLMVFPLIIGGRLLGILEAISRQGDEEFFDNQDLFATIAEHLSLALNSAILFENVERLAAYDPLTGIANHRTLQDFLHRRIVEAQRSNSTIGVIMIDVDHFRSFNEEEGHDAGDKVLKMVTEVLRSAVRPYDLAARYGGEEFTVVMPGASSETTFRIAERIRQSIEKLAYQTSSGRLRHVTASLGTAVYPENALDSASILKAADKALYNAKRSGRNRTIAFEGRFSSDRMHGDDRSQAVRQILPQDMFEVCDNFLRQCRPFVAHVVQELGLSESQQDILCAAALLYPAWARESKRGSVETLKEWSANPELRAVVPTVEMASERFDGTGPKKVEGKRIPLLSRVLAVLIALHLDHGRTLASDPSRFDPEIVEVVGEVDEAA